MPILPKPARPILPVTVLAALLAWPAALAAQSGNVNWNLIEFNFNPPGARAAAMGGAFIPLADDATAAESNPAGLTVLLYRQFSFEGKTTQYVRKTPRAFGGGTTTDNQAMPSFVSFVQPFRHGAVALFRHELVRYGYSGEFDYNPLDPNTCDECRSYHDLSNLDLGVANYGAAAAVRLGPWFSVGFAGGASITQYSQYERIDHSAQADPLVSEWSAPDGRATSTFFNAGAIARLGGRTSVGVVYKRRPKFTGLEESFRRTDRTYTQDRRHDIMIFVPDAVGAGISTRITEGLTVLADVEKIRYSQLTDARTKTEGASSTVADDGLEARAGLEYVLVRGRTPIALRAGLAHIPSSKIYDPESDPTDDVNEYFERGSARARFSAGVGAVLARRWQVDASFSRTTGRQDLALSLVYMFGRM